MKIIVTGALGHIGSKLIRELSREDFDLEILMVDNLSTQRYCSLFNLPTNVKYSFIEQDVKTVDWHNILKNNINVVIHLAALTDAAGTADKPEAVYRNNFESTKILVDACLEARVPIIFPSSTSVYGSQSELVDEECKELRPQSPYAACKLKEESYIAELCKKGLRGVICRLGTIYGTSPGMRFHTAVNKFCWQAVMEQPITVWETAMNQKRPYLSLKDAASAFIWIIKHNLFNGDIFNIVTSNHTVKEVLDAIQVEVSSLNITYVTHTIMNQLSYEVLSSKFKKTGFQFQGTLDAEIKETIMLIGNSTCYSQKQMPELSHEI